MSNTNVWQKFKDSVCIVFSLQQMRKTQFPSLFPPLTDPIPFVTFLAEFKFVEHDIVAQKDNT